MTVQLTGAQKSAVLLLLLDEPEAAGLLRQLDAAEVRAVGEAMLSVASIEPRAIDIVLDEFLAATQTTAALGQGGSQVRSVMVKALGEARAGRVLGRLGPPVTLPPFAGLAWTDPATIAAILTREHPQAATVILAHLSPAIAAEVLALLPEALQPDLLFRMAALLPVAGDVLTELEADFETALAATPPAITASRPAGPDAVAKLINLSADQPRLLDALRLRNPALAESIAQNLFVFADLARLDSRAMQTVVREIDPETLVVALKGADAGLRAQVFAAMSQRAAAQIEDDLAGRGPVKRADVDAAQAEIAGAVRRLADAGSVMLPGRAGGYV